MCSLDGFSKWQIDGARGPIVITNADGGDRSSRPAGAVSIVRHITSTTPMDLHRMFKPAVP
jgi:hypothetical protein